MNTKTHLIAITHIAISACLLVPLAAVAVEPIEFRSARKVGSLDQVTLSFELGGTRQEKDDSASRAGKPADSTKGKPAATKAEEKSPAKSAGIFQSPISAKCELEYTEKTTAMPTDRSAEWHSVRFYEKAAATAKEGSVELKPFLRPERALVAVQVDPPESVLFSPQGPLSYDELEVIDLTGNSLILDLLLPTKKVAPGDQWEVSDRVLSALLTLDRVTSNDVKCTLKEATDSVARFEISGALSGVKNDVVAKVELKGKYRFDFRLKRIDWFGLLASEKREIGAFEAGFDVVMKSQIRITPAQQCAALTDAALKKVSLSPSPEAMQLTHQSREAGWQVIADRRWYLAGSSPERALFRLVDRGEFISQCVISPKPKTSFDKLPTLAAFQDDVQQALDKNFGEFTAASEKVNSADYRVLRTCVRGESQGPAGAIPIEWRYYHVADRDGHQAVFLFTQEAKLAERLDGLDTAFINGFRFSGGPKGVTGGKKTGDTTATAAPKGGGAK